MITASELIDILAKSAKRERRRLLRLRRLPLFANSHWDYRILPCFINMLRNFPTITAFSSRSSDDVS